ncbi:flagellar assembly protein FliW [Paenibacillus sp. SC116]|uniref:flagellar assembly protein FliW n=1 Tax=Paenibacillus sp. SC116 TaxID=2968986 RepID=UPI00215A2327|nr:flagellar assembly protein FliW [Paenibacillus sp. SC116]MCR8844802.1 flagellar assembly protein FliW [Paenibacillus sp. SC116]
MEVQSTRLGTLQVEESDIISFENGILGFPNCKKYVWLQAIGFKVEIDLLQSVDDADLTFIVVNPFHHHSEYGFELSSNWKHKLNIVSEEQVLVRTIMTIKGGERMTINLKAPLVINTQSRQAAQVVLEGVPYDVQHPIGGES